MQSLTIRHEIRLDARLLWNVTKTREGNWLGVCQPLKLSIEGADREELAASIDEVVQMTLTDLLESGELERFLQAHGWTVQSAPVAFHELSRMKAPHFDVPIELLFDNGSGSSRRTAQ